MNQKWIGLLLVVSAGCSSPRYTYYFPQHQDPVEPKFQPTTKPIPPPQQEDMTASTQPETSVPAINRLPEARRTYRQKPTFGSVEVSDKAFPSAPPAPAKIENDAKLGIIFFVSGVIVYVIGSPVFTVVGSLAMLIGIIFGIKWLLRQ